MQLPVNLGNVEPATGFDYPPGQYLFRVDSCEIRTNQDGVGQRLLVFLEEAQLGAAGTRQRPVDQQ